MTLCVSVRLLVLEMYRVEGSLGRDLVMRA